jgi:hypothetical protein
MLPWSLFSPTKCSSVRLAWTGTAAILSPVLSSQYQIRRACLLYLLYQVVILKNLPYFEILSLMLILSKNITLIFLVLCWTEVKHVGAVSDYHDLFPHEFISYKYWRRVYKRSAVMELHINVGYVSFIVWNPVVYSIWYKQPLYLVVVLKRYLK